MKLSDIIRDKIPEGTFWTHSRTIIDGCTPISPGCKNCWLAGMYRRNLPGMKTFTEMLTPGGCFNGTVMERPDRLEGIIPQRPRKPRVWTYWSDLFHPGVSDRFKNQLFACCALSSQDYHIIITKRPDEAARYFSKPLQYFPLPNVIILVTMEDQERANQRCPHALTLAEMGWNVGILAEPLLEAINLRQGIYAESSGFNGTVLSTFFKWLITGGESGHNARPAHPDWFRSLRDQARVAGVPFMLKQMGSAWARDYCYGGKTVSQWGDRSGSDSRWWSSGLCVRQVPDL